MRFQFEGLRTTRTSRRSPRSGWSRCRTASPIDEVRERLDMPPWGLTETSEPVVFTAQGPIPFSMAPQLIANMQGGGAGGQGTNSRAAHHVVAVADQPAERPPRRADEAQRQPSGTGRAAPGIRNPRPLRRRRGDPVARRRAPGAPPPARAWPGAARRLSSRNWARWTGTCGRAG